MYYYSNEGAVGRIEYYENSVLKQVEKYYYDTADRLCRVVGLNGSTDPTILYEYSWTYDHNNNVTNLVEIIDGVKTVYNYGYNTEQQASSAAYGNTNKTFAYDGYGRFSNSIVYSGSVAANNERIKEYIEYKTTGSYATNQVSKFISKWSRSSTNYSSDTYQYTYDANGNITAIKGGNGANLVTYQYDSNDQLIWERNYITIGDDTNGRAYKYTYDTGGNILSKTTYSSADATSGGTEVKYTYGDSVWGDKLTTYNGVVTDADASGNIKILNGWEFAYQGGRQLASAKNTDEGKTLAFTYNDAGLRTSKTSNGVKHTYTYNGSLLASDIVENANAVFQYGLYFRYDQNGAPIGFAYKTNSGTTEYYYLKNLQGDITGIVDTAGNRVATYVYDAWGNNLSITGSNTDLAGKNLLRYRGYVYDTESGLYYLQSRYYSPTIGRFISADAYAMTYESPVGANMFVYCMNNPVSMADDGGEWAHIAVGAVIGAAMNVAMSYLFAVQNGDSYSAKEAFVDGLGGAVSGALAASGFGKGAQILANGLISATSTIAKGILNDKPATGGEIISSACAGMISGLIGGDGLTKGTKAVKHMKVLNTKPKISSAYANSFNVMSKEMGLAQSRFLGGGFAANLITSWYNDVGHILFG